MNSLDRARLRWTLRRMGLRLTILDAVTGEETWLKPGRGDRTVVTIVWDPMDLVSEEEARQGEP